MVNRFLVGGKITINRHKAVHTFLDMFRSVSRTRNSSITRNRLKHVVQKCMYRFVPVKVMVLAGEFKPVHVIRGAMDCLKMCKNRKKSLPKQVTCWPTGCYKMDCGGHLLQELEGFVYKTNYMVLFQVHPPPPLLYVSNIRTWLIFVNHKISHFENDIGWWEWRHFITNTGRTKTISTTCRLKASSGREGAGRLGSPFPTWRSLQAKRCRNCLCSSCICNKTFRKCKFS